MCQILCLNNNQILVYLPAVINLCIDILFASEANQHQAYDFFLVYPELSTEIELMDNCSIERLKLYKNDPVISTELKTFIFSKLNEIGNIHGIYFQQVMQSIDPIIMSQLQSFNKPNQQQ
eukprot:TRINITY_DN2495_c0_g2_i1.p1 TRINITY_DN2495_c0_g2~~TRINITY_DN2495_c0_g2_i1.p1  ORF type:complete len:120 (-),score=44.44 TRINITY_DN2495_c0_g2_i1:15-374(-)